MNIDVFVYGTGALIMLIFTGIIIYGMIDSWRMGMYPWIVILFFSLIASVSAAWYSIYMVIMTI